MNAIQPSDSGLPTRFEQLRYAREIIQTEGQAVLRLADRLDQEFCRAAELVFACSGSIIVSGMGKAGLIGQKLAATFASTGTRSHFLHPGEAVHGDLGRVHASDLVLMLSQSGETEEISRLLPTLEDQNIPILAITGQPESKLAQAAEVVLDLGPLQEACNLGLAPSTSTTAMLAMGDALALVVSRMRGFGREDFARFHPAGSLGRKLAKVDEYMRSPEQCRIAHLHESVRDVLIRPTYSGRRTGAVMITDSLGKLRGIFTDSDLARLFESRRDVALDGPIETVMTQQPTTVRQGTLLSDAVEIMGKRKISELPVLDSQGTPVGMLDITDLVTVLPEAQTFDFTAAAEKRSEPRSAVPKPKHLTLLHPSTIVDPIDEN